MGVSVVVVVVGVVDGGYVVGVSVVVFVVVVDVGRG